LSNLLIKDQAGFHVEKGAVFEAGLRSSLDAGTDNLSFKHWDGLEQSATADTLWLEPRTRTSGITAGRAPLRIHCGWNRARAPAESRPV